MLSHPAEVTWEDAARRVRISRSKACGDKTLWSTSVGGGHITWEGLLRFIGENGRATLHLAHSEET